MEAKKEVHPFLFPHPHSSTPSFLISILIFLKLLTRLNGKNFRDRNLPNKWKDLFVLQLSIHLVFCFSIHFLFYSLFLNSPCSFLLQYRGLQRVEEGQARKERELKEQQKQQAEAERQRLEKLREQEEVFSSLTQPFSPTLLHTPTLIPPHSLPLLLSSLFPSVVNNA